MHIIKEMKGLYDKSFKILKREAKAERGGREGNGEKCMYGSIKTILKNKKKKES